MRASSYMIDVARWLAGLGLGRHVTAFRENGIGADVLRDLTDADLRSSASISATASGCSRRSLRSSRVANPFQHHEKQSAVS